MAGTPSHDGTRSASERPSEGPTRDCVAQTSRVRVVDSFKRYRLPLPWGARLDDARRICRCWAERFGKYAAFRLNDERLRLLMARLVDEGHDAESICWAIVAYHEFCRSDKWHREHPDAHKTIENFLRDERFEDALAKGQDAARDWRRRQARRGGLAARVAAADRMGSLLRSWQQLPAPDRLAVLQQAVRALELRGPLAGARDERNPLVRSKVCQLMQQRADVNGNTPARISGAIDEALS